MLKHFTRALLCLSLLFSTAFAMHPERIKNLSNIHYPQKVAVTKAIQQLADTTDANNAYALSLPLIASALQGDKTQYTIQLAKMRVALDAMPDNFFKAWLLGRVLLAADSMDDVATVNTTVTALKTQLAKPIDVPHSDMDYAFYAWAHGYLAALTNETYQAYRARMLETAGHLAKVYEETATHDALSNALWAWVMALQAASNAQDTETYAMILEQMKSLTKTTDLRKALETSLTRTDTSSDYPAWAIGMVSLSAAGLHDEETRQLLQGALIKAIVMAKNWGETPGQTPENVWKAQAEMVLGQLYAVLAKVQR